MELPDDVVKIIQEFSKPLGRCDWKNGSYIMRHYQSMESNFKSDLLMRVHDWREHNLEFEDFVTSYTQLYDNYDLWKNTYHAYYFPVF
jgi:hypothetical protein